MIVFFSLMFREEIKQLLKNVLFLKFIQKMIGKTDAVITRELSNSMESKDKNNSVTSKMTAYCYSVCEDIKIVYIFKNDIVFTEYRPVFEGFSELIERERKSGRHLVLSLVNIKVMNDFAREVFRDVIFDTIIQNNVRMMIVFPDLKNANPILLDLYNELHKKITEKSSKTIRLKKVK